ncbi:MBL fold metallo-hydrolase [Halococcus sp. AFM35]|uniref:MBL fold metallo-hydrolase n=1 Tax=Halococcus sp. AFM35 TaxID=3421653 RepID=UPI003EB8A28D
MDVHTVTEGAETFTANVYLVTGEHTVLVDAGTMAGVEDVIAEHTADLDAVVLTHQHGDHVGELDAVLDRFDVDLLAYGDHPRRTEEIDDGDTIDIGDERFDVIHTPGHADDHVSLVSETTIFSGDVVVHDDGAFDDGSFGRTDMAGQSREVLIESIERILERLPEGVEHMYAGHGEAFHGDVRAVIERALERAERREPKYPE